MSFERRLDYRHPDGTTAVLVGPGVLARAPGLVAPWLAGRSLFVVTTPRVRHLHGAALAALAAPAARCLELPVAEGEAAKDPAVAIGLWRRMLAAGGKRDSRLIAFGGGSVGDLGGFVAGCFLRGIEYLQVPTTLLAQVDASVGGKTAVDLPEGKNSVGLFHHPAWVLADTRLLATLPAAEVRSGLVEVVKMALLLDPRLFARVERDLEPLLAADAETLAPVVAAAVAAKISVVEPDPTEGGVRALLNFGHTLAHALETCQGYSGLRHGEAVAYGMLFALRLAAPRGLPPPVAERLRRLLARFDLPPLPPLAVADLLPLLGRDKKARESGLVWVLPRDLGRGEVVPGIGGEEVAVALGRFLADPLA